MKRFLPIAIGLALLLTGCSAEPDAAHSALAPAQSPTPTETLQPESSVVQAESTSSLPEALPTEPPEEEQENILIAYFTWAENTHVEDPASIDVDATTSASVLLPGNTAKLAGWIQQECGGDLFSIVVEEPYSSDYDECLARAADEKAGNARPALANHVEDMARYDVVFLGFPNWWYTVPMAVHTFLEEYDFSGKTIIPFVTHGTGGMASTIEDITAGLPDSVTVSDPIGVYRQDVDGAREAIREWLAGLDIQN